MASRFTESRDYILPPLDPYVVRRAQLNVVTKLGRDCMDVLDALGIGTAEPVTHDNRNEYGQLRSMS
jgi:hypothetical protein